MIRNNDPLMIDLKFPDMAPAKKRRLNKYKE